MRLARLPHQGSCSILISRSSSIGWIRIQEGLCHVLLITECSPWLSCCVQVFDATTGTELHTFAGHSQWVVSLAFAPSGGTLASASWDGTLKLWDLYSGSLLASYEGHSRRVHACAFSPDGALVASASWDCTVMVSSCLDRSNFMITMPLLVPSPF